MPTHGRKTAEYSAAAWRTGQSGELPGGELGPTGRRASKCDRPWRDEMMRSDEQGGSSVKKDRKRPLMAVLNAQRRFLLTRRCVFLALLLAISWMLIAPGESQAHAILLRSEPAKDAVVSVSPGQVHLWFSEDLNPALSTVTIVNQANAQVDAGNAQVSARDSREMDIALKSHLPPAVYVVIYRSASNDDGHLLSVSVLFTVARPDCTPP